MQNDLSPDELSEYAAGLSAALNLPEGHLTAWLARVSPGKPLSRDALRAAADHVRDARRGWRAAVTAHRDAKVRDRVRAKGRGW